MYNKAFYLKINREEDFAFSNLLRWIRVAMISDSKCYILCDKIELIEKIKEKLWNGYTVSFIKSDKSAFSEKIVQMIACKRWKNAAYAHLTTFLHAKKMQHTYFWNIDADDTQLCLSDDRIKELLDVAEEYAEKNNIDAFSLDMWRSKTQGKHWSFGITYINGSLNWENLLYYHSQNELYKMRIEEERGNIDWFFTDLRSTTDFKLETFYFENLKFIHYSDDFFKKPVSAGFYHWKNNKLIHPIILYCFGIEEIGKFNIYKDVIKLDIGIKDDEATNMLTYYCNDEWDLSIYGNWRKIENKKILRKKMSCFLSQKLDLVFQNNVDNFQIVAWGTGDCFKRNIGDIKDIWDIRLAVDNNSQKWECEVEKDIVCISPELLKGKDNVFVFIFVDNNMIAEDIAKQLLNLGVSNYAHIDEWRHFQSSIV